MLIKIPFQEFKNYMSYKTKEMFAQFRLQKLWGPFREVKFVPCINLDVPVTWLQGLVSSSLPLSSINPRLLLSPLSPPHTAGFERLFSTVEVSKLETNKFVIMIKALSAILLGFPLPHWKTKWVQHYLIISHLTFPPNIYFCHMTQ